MLRHLQAAFAILFAFFPLLGALAWGWSVQEIIILYWVENLIIGFWQLFKMLTIKNTPLAAKLFMMAFFSVHFGIFCMVHGIFIMNMTGPRGMMRGFQTPLDAIDNFSKGALLAIASNIIMHGIRVVRTHIIEKGREKTNIGAIMAEPYAHIVVIHIAILAAGFLATAFNAALPLLGLIILGKLALDLRAIYENGNTLKP